MQCLWTAPSASFFMRSPACEAAARHKAPGAAQLLRMWAASVSQLPLSGLMPGSPLAQVLAAGRWSATGCSPFCVVFLSPKRSCRGYQKLWGGKNPRMPYTGHSLLYPSPIVVDPLDTSVGFSHESPHCCVLHLAEQLGRCLTAWIQLHYS